MTTIKTMHELSERLEAIRRDLDPRHLTLLQYERVGWALRHLDGLLDRCREELASSSYTERRVQFFDGLTCPTRSPAASSSIAALPGTRPLASTATAPATNGAAA